MGIGLCGIVLGLALRDMKMPWGLSDKTFFWLGVAPALAQMAIAARMPMLCWISPFCLAALWRMVKDKKAPPEDDADKFKLNIPHRTFYWAFLLLLPVCVWDWRQFPALYGTWALALLVLRSA